MRIIANFPGQRKAKKKSARTKQVRVIIGIASGTILFLLFLLYKYDPLVPLKREIGTTIDVFNTQSRYGSGTYYVIELNSGEKVNVNASRMESYKKGRRVIVEKMESRIFHKNVYRFIEYKD